MILNESMKRDWLIEWMKEKRWDGTAVPRWAAVIRTLLGKSLIPDNLTLLQQMMDQGQLSVPSLTFCVCVVLHFESDG